jgi:putative PEP-CTERM system TPR-repeat lipoprotein
MLEGDVTGGVSYLERSGQAAPDDKSRALQLAAAYRTAHRSADALALLQKLEVPDELAVRREYQLLGALTDLGRTAEVHAEAQRFAQARPTDLSALLIAAEGLRASQDVAGARALLAQAAALDPKAPQPWIQLGWLEREQHDLPASQRAFAHALELAPQDNGALFGAAQSDLDHGNAAVAIQKLEQVRTQAPRALAPRIALARLYLAAGQVQQADTVLAEARALSADNPDVRHLGALLALAQGKGPQAVTALEELARQFPKAAGLQVDLARAYALTGRPAEAHARAEAALRIDPNYWPALVTEIAVSLGQKDLRGADAALERLRRTNAPEATVLTVSGDLAQRSGKFDDALKAYTAANALSPSGPLALKMYVARRALHSPDSAAPLRDWLKHSPSDIAVRLALAEQLQLDGQNAAAAEEYQAVLKQAPQQVVALNNLALLKLEGGDAQAGLDLAHRAYTNNNGQPSVADTYGWALVQTGHAEDALPLLRDASGKMPGNDSARYHLGVALVRTGAIHEGRVQLKAVADSASHTAVSEKARALLANLDAGGKG